MVDRVNTGGLTVIEYNKNHKQSKLSDKEKEELKKTLEEGRIKQAERMRIEKEKEEAWKKRWKRYNLWKKIRPYILWALGILIALYLLKRFLI